MKKKQALCQGGKYEKLQRKLKTVDKVMQCFNDKSKTFAHVVDWD